MELFIGCFLEIFIFFGIMFTRERNSKLNYVKNIGAIFIICQLCTLFTFPVYGNIFGLPSMIMTSMILGTMVRFK